MLIVGKIGGTSMSQFDMVMENIIKHPSAFVNPKDSSLAAPHNRLFVVSAYGGVTNFLLEHKKTGKAGIYEKFVKKSNFQNQMEHLLDYLKKINLAMRGVGLDITQADRFIEKRIHDTFNLLKDLDSVFSSGYLLEENIYLAAREILASLGEVHSAYNSMLICESQGVKAKFLDLSGLNDQDSCTIDQRILKNLRKCKFDQYVTFVTGYVKGVEGIMREFDRGYSDITFSKVCVLLQTKLKRQVKEGVIYKEFHLSSADPMIVGEKNVVPVGNTNYDVADQLADVGMEAIHPKASKPLEEKGINLRVKNTFEPEHEGTRITKTYRGEKARVEIITGSREMILLEIHDPQMVGTIGFDMELCQVLLKHRVSYIFKSTNANSISHVIWQKNLSPALEKELKKKYQLLTRKEVAIICVIGTNIAIPGVLAKASMALSEAKVNVLCMGQSLRQVNMQFIIERKNFEQAIKSLNNKFFK